MPYFDYLRTLLLDLEVVGENVFRSKVLPKEANMWLGTKRGVFGGQVAAQSLAAAYRTVPNDRLCHSFHSYFISSGDKAKPIDYVVRTVRNGRSYSSRVVEGVQNERKIFTMIASFSLPEGDTVHVNHPMPSVPMPHTLDINEFLRRAVSNENLSVELREAAKEQLERYARMSLEIRPTDPLIYYRLRQAEEPIVRMWTRVREAPNDLRLTTIESHTLTAYIADMGILRGGLVSDISLQPQFVTSLDHSVYFHEPIIGNEYLLFESQCLYGGRGRTSNKGHLWRPDGALVATIFQEGLVRFVNGDQASKL